MKSALIIVALSMFILSYGLDDAVQVNADVKQQAFTILDSKCNSCHRIKNKRRVFTMENMDGYAKKIHKQVFVWKRMPKRGGQQLTNMEYETLKQWLSQKISK